MAEKKITNLEALEMAFAMATDAGNGELAAKLEKMATSERNKREKAAGKKSDPTKTKGYRKMLEVLVKIVDAGNEQRSSQWIQEHVSDMLTVQKVTGVVALGREAGFISYGEKVNGKVTYIATAAGVEKAAELTRN